MSTTRMSLVVAGVLVILFAAVVLPVAGLFLMQGTEADEALAQLGTYRMKIASAPRLRAEAAAVARQEADAGVLITGTSTSLAAANMQNLILDIVRRHGGQLRSSQALNPSPGPRALSRVVVQFEVSLPPGSLKAATYELESMAPYLYVDAADIRPELYGGSSATAPTALHVSWTVHAYRKMDAP